MTYPPPTTQQQRALHVQDNKLVHNISVRQSVLESDTSVPNCWCEQWRKTTLIKDSINCCHRHAPSSLALVRPTAYIRRPASQRLLKCQIQECLPSRMSNAPEFDEYCRRDDDTQTRCDMSHPIYDMGGCLQLNSHYKAGRCNLVTGHTAVTNWSSISLSQHNQTGTTKKYIML